MSNETASQRRKGLVTAAGRLGADQDGVVSRQQLRAIGVTRAHVRTEVRAGRWSTHGRNTVAIRTGDLSERGEWRRAVIETGADAALDGVTALKAGGLKGYHEDQIHVTVSRGRHPPRLEGVVVHETRRREAGDVIVAGIPRVRPATAAIRGALWAKSDRQAALIIVMAAQQRLTTAAALQVALRNVRRDKRRSFLAVIVRDVAHGAQALGELDFARLCRDRGLPEPNRQVLRRAASGRYYLDVYWSELGVVVEVEGLHHGWGKTQIDDALRQNALTIAHDSVLRIPLLGLRLEPDLFMCQVEQMLRPEAA